MIKSVTITIISLLQCIDGPSTKVCQFAQSLKDWATTTHFTLSFNASQQPFANRHSIISKVNITAANLGFKSKFHHHPVSSICKFNCNPCVKAANLVPENNFRLKYLWYRLLSPSSKISLPPVQ